MPILVVFFCVAGCVSVVAIICYCTKKSDQVIPRANTTLAYPQSELVSNNAQSDILQAPMPLYPIPDIPKNTLPSLYSTNDLPKNNPKFNDYSNTKKTIQINSKDNI